MAYISGSDVNKYEYLFQDLLTYQNFLIVEKNDFKRNLLLHLLICTMVFIYIHSFKPKKENT